MLSAAYSSFGIPSPVNGVEEYLQALPVAVVALDEDCRIRWINPAAEQLLQASLAASRNKPFLEMVEDRGGTLADWLIRALERRESIQAHEHAFFPLRGSRTAVSLHIVPLAGGGCMLVADPLGITPRLARQARTRQRAESAGLMAAMLAHEIKNPLSGIRGAAQLLGEEAPAAQKPLAELICCEVDRIGALLGQISLLGRSGEIQKAPVNIHEALQYAIAVASTGFGAHVTFIERYDPSLPLVLGQRDLLVQLFLNLIKNASEAVSERQDARITLSTAYHGFMRMHAGAKGRGAPLPVVVSVHDNGPGVPEELREHIFEPFVTSHGEGRGLGLAVAERIATDLCGMVELDESAQSGAKFQVFLPVAGA